MNVAESIKERQNEIAIELSRLTDEQNRLSDALKIIGDVAPVVSNNDNKTTEQPTPVTATKESLIKDAVKRGHKKPATIHKFIRTRYRVDMNIGSLRSTLSRLKNDGAIVHDASGWAIAH